jgi:hypothetical protein
MHETLKKMVPGENGTKISILSSSNADSWATHPASSKLLKNEEEAPLSRGELRKALSACGSITSTESVISPLERYWRRLRSSRGVVPSREGGLLRDGSLKISRSRRGVSALAAKCFSYANLVLTQRGQAATKKIIIHAENAENAEMFFIKNRLAPFTFIYIEI